ncbi:MAG TPA: response regulator transcription factor [Usitatibacter sp.]|jgi:DNA-binding NarL/FixJ family response regulator
MTIKVLLADDHRVLRDGLAALLETQEGISVVGHASDGREAVRKALELKPDVAIMDIVMPELDGIEATRLILRSLPLTRVVILSMYSTTEHIFRALQAGAKGYLLKESAGSELVAAVRGVHAGRRFLSQKITESVVEDYVREHVASDPLGTLSARERQILQLVAAGRSSADIARVLSLSPKTVDTYRSRLMQKLEIDNFAALVKFAIACGLTPP